MIAFPYRLTIWRSSRYKEQARFEDFNLALACYGSLRDETKQLVHMDRAECGKSGLTEEESEAVRNAT